MQTTQEAAQELRSLDQVHWNATHSILKNLSISHFAKNVQFFALLTGFETFFHVLLGVIFQNWSISASQSGG